MHGTRAPNGKTMQSVATPLCTLLKQPLSLPSKQALRCHRRMDVWTTLLERGTELLSIIHNAKTRETKLAALRELDEILKYATNDPDVFIQSGWTTLSGDTICDHTNPFLRLKS